MKTMHLVVPDLFLPSGLASGVDLPLIQKWVARGQRRVLPAETLEQWLCTQFGVGEQAVAPVTLQADGIAPGANYWLRADPVHLHILHDRLILRTVGSITPAESEQLCAALNKHFEDEGLYFCMPHPQRWYLRTETAPEIVTHALSQVEGGDIQTRLPVGNEALRWHRLLNEVQMLLYSHPVNDAREARGVPTINSVWLWGGGKQSNLQSPYDAISGDSELTQAFANVAGIPWVTMEQMRRHSGRLLCISESLQQSARQGDLLAWRANAEALERNYVAPLIDMLRKGEVNSLTLDVPQAGTALRVELKRSDLWKFWRRVRSLEYDALK